MVAYKRYLKQNAKPVVNMGKELFCLKQIMNSTATMQKQDWVNAKIKEFEVQQQRTQALRQLEAAAAERPLLALPHIHLAQEKVTKGLHLKL